MTVLHARGALHAARLLLVLVALLLGTSLAQPELGSSPTDLPADVGAPVVTPSDDAPFEPAAPESTLEDPASRDVAPPDATQQAPESEEPVSEERASEAPASETPTVEEVTPAGDAAETGTMEPLDLTLQGAYLLVRNTDGVVQRRFALPAPAIAVEPTEADRVRVTVAYQDGTEGVLDVSFEAADVPVRFGTDPAIFTQVREAASAVPEAGVAAAAARDPTDPWLALAAWRAAPSAEQEARLDALLTAAQGVPFFETFAVAGELLEAGLVEEATRLLDAATRDFAARSYDPRLVTHPTLRSAYGLPDVLLTAALDRGDGAAARTLAPYAWRFAAPSMPSGLEALERHADLLTVRGEVEDAATWRERLGALRAGTLADGLDRFILALANLGWWSPVALLAGTFLLWLVLLAKAWRARTLLARQRVERGGSRRPLGRLWVPRYASTTEKLVLLTLLALAGLSVSLAHWNDVRNQPALALQSGTFASEPAYDATRALPDGPHAAWLRGLADVQRGDRKAALDAWTSAGAFAPTLVNRAVVQGAPPDAALLERALDVDPGHAEARYLLGRGDDPSVWHATTLPDAPRYAMPTLVDVTLAQAGDWRVALAETLRAPWRTLPEAVPAGLPTWTWWTMLGAYGLLLILIALNLFVPRPRLTRNAPRTFAYHLGALLVPGSGHADELWGVLILIPWSILGVDALLTWQSGTTGPLGIDATLEHVILAILFTVNLIGFTIELLSYRERMWRLRETNPDLAHAFGLPPTRSRDTA